jgi:hypothetical protein
MSSLMRSVTKRAGFNAGAYAKSCEERSGMMKPAAGTVFRGRSGGERFSAVTPGVTMAAMTDLDNDAVPRLQQAIGARATIRSWAVQARALALLEAVRRSGILTGGDRFDPATAAKSLGIPDEQMRDVVAVLTAMDVLTADGAAVRLTPAFQALFEGQAGVSIDSALDEVRMEVRQSGDALDPPAAVSGADALVLASDTGVAAAAGSRALYSMVYAAIPEFVAPLSAGGTLLDVGCGVGGALLTTAMLYPAARVVGIERVPEVAAETRRRAEQLRLQDRVEVRTGRRRSSPTLIEGRPWTRSVRR